MEITYDYYRIFYYVAKYGNFTRAATILGSNQPNISKYIGKLEKQLGCKLFVRSNRGVTMTPEAEKLYAHVSIAYEHIREAELELENDKTLQNGNITIGVSSNALHGMVLEALSWFRDTYPGIRLCVLNYSTPDALQVLKNGLVDFSVVTTPFQVDAGYIEMNLRTYKEILVGGSHYESLAGSVQSLKDLVQYPFVGLRKGTATYDLYMQFFLDHGLIYDPNVEVTISEQLSPMILNNLGIGFVADGIVQEAIRAGKIFQIPIKEDVPERSICLIQDRSRHLGEAAKALKQRLLYQRLDYE